MEVKKLMIGDYVSYIDTFGKRKIGKVTDLHNNESWGTIYVDFCDQNPEGKSKIISVQPIPLTAEILHKNGFSIEKGGYIMTLAIENTFTMNLDDEYGQHKWSIIITNGPWNIKIKVFGMLAISIVIHFVHELQHALRLVGLNKMADNLKVE